MRTFAPAAMGARRGWFTALVAAVSLGGPVGLGGSIGKAESLPPASGGTRWEAATTPTGGASGLTWEAVPSPSADQQAQTLGLAWEAVPAGDQLVVTGVDANLTHPDHSPPSDQAANPAQADPRRLEPTTEIDPTAGGLRIAAPYIGGGLPGAYNASGWDYYVAGSAGTPGKLRDGQPDGSLNVGFGIGNPYSLASVAVGWNIGSIKNLNFNGGFDVSASRVLITQPNLEVAIGGGWLSFYSYGNEGVDVPNGYGVATVSIALQPNNPRFPQLLQISGGIGGNSFSTLDPVTYTGPSIGYYATAGLEVTEWLGLSAGWSGRGINAGLSVVPFPRSLPISLTLTAADVGNQSPYGTVGILTLAWGGNLKRDFGYSQR